MWVSDPRVTHHSQMCKLAADTETFDDCAVALDVGLGQVLEQTTTLTDHQQQAAAAVVIVLVRLEVLGELIDAVGGAIEGKLTA